MSEKSSRDTSDTPKSNLIKNSVLLDPVAKAEYFYGVLPRQDTPLMLLHDGEFLVRQTKKICADASGAVISVRWKDDIVHVVIMNHAKGYVLEDCPFPTIEELIQYYLIKGIPVTQQSGAVLKTPIHRANWVIHDTQLRMVEKLGEGEFGEVWKAELTADDGNKIMVAVKRLKSDEVPKDEQKLFYDECRHLRQLRHPHIVNFKGVSLDTSVKLVMELCDESLLGYLQKNKTTITHREHLRLITHASRGMAYLASQKMIHRDVAARNCLLKGAYLKIADFGMARRGEIYSMAPSKKPLPVKWMPPDALMSRNFSEKSDVWSFGVLMWEILTNGGSPYIELVESCEGPFVIELLKFLKNGYRLVPPPKTPKELRTLMEHCWNIDPEKRPKFEELNHRLERLLNPISLSMRTSMLISKTLGSFRRR